MGNVSVHSVRKGIGAAAIRPVSAEVESFRARFRAKRRPSMFQGWRHLAAITALGVGAPLLCARMVRGPVWWEWASIPVGFLIANLVEWLAHRYPMHHPMRPLVEIYEKHTLEHHRFFTDRAMETESAEDFDAVLFSLPSLALFLLGTALPVAVLFFAFVSWNAGWIFVALAVDYYLLYEYCHLAYHLPRESWVGRLPGMAQLSVHHIRHHDQRLMANWNFNVTFPIFDLVFGTRWRRAE